MRLFKFGEAGREKCGIEIRGELYSAARLARDYDEKFLENGGLLMLQAAVLQGDPRFSRIKNPGKIRFGAPIGRPSKIICIGLNYARHAAETGMAAPTEPIVFFKSTTAICGPHDPLILPRNSVKTDWEVELALLIGKKASYVEEADAMDYVAGYLLHNDYSERAFQMERGGQWVKGKSCDSFAPMGPFLVTKDEVPNPNKLHLWLDVNGERLQDSNTDDMIFDVPFLVHYVSQFMTLLPGDVITTGTPFGVGLGFNPPRYLKEGDVVELGIEGLGQQRQEVQKPW